MTCVLRLFYSHKGSYIEYVGEGDGVGDGGFLWGHEIFKAYIDEP